MTPCDDLASLMEARLERDLWHTAVHEAGHAVIGRVLAMLCGPATIKADHDSAGHSITADPWAIAWKWEIAGKHREMASIWRGRIMTSQAGAEALAEIVGGEVSPGDEDDLYQCALMARELECGDAEEARLRRHTRRLVRRHRPTIEHLATALIDKGGLSTGQIDAIVWPRATMNGFVSYSQLRPRFRISGTRRTLEMAMASGNFPRARIFNGRALWRARDIEKRIAVGHDGAAQQRVH
jgi:hypothetical protein